MEALISRLQGPLSTATGSRPKACAAARDGGFVVSIISDPAAIEALGPEWSALFETCGRPHQVFQTFAWLRIWAQLYVDRRTRPSIVTGRVGGRLVLVWPLVVRRHFGLRVLSGMGEPLSQYCDAIVAADHAETALVRAFDEIRRLPVDVMSFRRVRDDAAIAPVLRARCGAPANLQAAPFVAFEPGQGMEVFEARFPGKLRSSRRRRRRRLEERGTLSYATFGPSLEAAALIAEALSFKRAWARKTGLPARSLRDPRFEAFFHAAALAGRLAPDLRVSAFRCGAETVGVEISVACKGRLFGHVLAPHPDWGAFGIGGLLAQATITGACERGFEAIDLLAPADPYKLDWTSTCVGVGDYTYSRGAFGALYARIWLRHGRALAKRLVGRMRQLKASRAGRAGAPS